MIKGKKALSGEGHEVFLFLMAILAYYMLRDFIKISWLTVLICFPFYFLGSRMGDFLQKKGFNHREFTHSHFFLVLNLFILVPITICLSIIKTELWIIATSFCLGHAVHNFGDSLTSQLPRI